MSHFFFFFFFLFTAFKIHLHWSKDCWEYVVIRFSNNLINQSSYWPEEVSSSFAAGSTCRKGKASFSSLEIKNYLKMELLSWNQPCLQITLTIFHKVLTGQRNLIFQQTLRLQGREWGRRHHCLSREREMQNY